MIQEASFLSTYESLLAVEPRPIQLFVPSNAQEQKALFLDGKVDVPQHVYSKLEDLNFVEVRASLTKNIDDLLSHPEMIDRYRFVYEEVCERYLLQVRFVELASFIQSGINSDDVVGEWGHLNHNLYGSPDENTYRALLHKELKVLQQKSLPLSAAYILEELLTLVKTTNVQVPLFIPSEATILWLKSQVKLLMKDLLECVPVDKETFTPSEVRNVLQTAVDKIDDTEQWVVLLEEAQSINVKTFAKQVIVPVHSKDISQTRLVELVAHEIGVHVYRSIRGEKHPLLVMRTGLPGYLDAEEGLGSVVEQSLQGIYKERGVGHYLTIGLTYFDNLNFREAFEVKWRLSLLQSLEEELEVTEDLIFDAKVTAYGQVMRVLRGAGLPWFKDLSYFNGSAIMWKYFSEIAYNNEAFLFTFEGKTDPADSEHRCLLQQR